MDTVGGSAPQDGTISTTVTTTAQTLITKLSNETGVVLMGTFLTPVGFLTSTTINPGIWDMQLYAYSNNATDVTYYFDLYSVGNDGTSGPLLISTGTLPAATIITATQTQYLSSIYVPLTTLANSTRRLRVQVWANFASNKHLTLEFRDSTLSHLTTTLGQIAGATGPAGATGATGATGVTGQSLSWLNGVPTGNFYDKIAVSVPPTTNTQLFSQSVNIPSATTKVLIISQGTALLNGANQTAYATLGRHTGPTGTAAINLAVEGGTGTLATAINSGIDTRMWATVSSTSLFGTSVICNVVDTPGVVGTNWYSLWFYTSGTASAENVFMTILQVSP